MPIHDSIVDLVGDTPLVRLQSVASDCPADIVGKAEFFNPLSSVKDRIGKNMIAEAEREGVIDEETLLVEPTSGNTGIALACVCAARGYDLVLTMPDTMSRERRSMFRALGAEVEMVASSLGMHGAVERAREIVGERDHAHMLQQFENPANPEAHAKSTAHEIWEATDGDIDAIVTGVGTGGTITGVTRVLKAKNPDFQSIAIEPAGSPVLSGEDAGPHMIQGIGAGFVPETLEQDLLDDVITVEDQQSFEMARRLAREEGLLVGPSAGANVVGAIKVGERREFHDKRIVTILCDSGERYLSTPLYRDV
jgi:cysteine synthase A